MIEAMLMGATMGIGIKSYQRVSLTDVGTTYGIGVHTVPITAIDARKALIIGLKCNIRRSTSENRGPAITSLTDNDFSFEIFSTQPGQQVAFEILEMSGIQEVRRGYYREGDSLTEQLGPIADPNQTIVVPEIMGNYIPLNSGQGNPSYVAYQYTYQLYSVTESGITMSPGSQNSTRAYVYVLLQAIIV